MTSVVTELSPVLVEVKVEIPWDRVQKALDEGYARVQRTARLKGFRPGKVPRNVVKQMFGAQVRYEAMSSVIENELFSAVREHDISPVASPDVQPEKLIDGQPLAFTAKIEVRPKVESVDTTGLTVERVSSDVTDAQVDEEIERLRGEHAVLRAPETARGTQKGDTLTIDYKVLVDGKESDELSATGRPAEIGVDRLLPELDQGLLGAAAGEERSIDVTFPEDHGSEQLRGKTVTFQVKIHELKERVLPELDDEFAKDCGNFQTLLELRLDARKKLEEAAKRRMEHELREAVVESLVDKNPITVPPSLLSQQERAMVEDFANMLGMSPDAMPLSDEMRKNFRERAEKKVRAALILGALAKRESITVTDADVEARIGVLAERTGKNPAKLRVEYRKGEDRREGLESQILEDKLLDYLFSVATITDAAPRKESDAPAAASGEEKPKAKTKKSKKEKEGTSG